MTKASLQTRGFWKTWQSAVKHTEVWRLPKCSLVTSDASGLTLAPGKSRLKEMVPFKNAVLFPVKTLSFSNFQIFKFPHLHIFKSSNCPYAKLHKQKGSCNLQKPFQNLFT